MDSNPVDKTTSTTPSQASSIDMTLLSGAPQMMVAQTLIVVLVSAGFYFYQGSFAAQSALYGGSIAILNLWTAYRRLRTAAEISKTAPGREVAVFYVGAVQRFVTTLLMFVAGMMWLALDPMALLAAFMVAQLGLLFKKA